MLKYRAILHCTEQLICIYSLYIYIHMYKSFEQFQKPQLVTIIRDYITTHYVGADHNP